MVKIKLAETSDKGLNSYIWFKKFPKHGSKDVSEKWFRNLKAAINTISLSAGSFKKWPLQHPRAEPELEQQIFIHDDRNFDGQLYQSAMMLYNMLGTLADKISKFLYLTLTYCVYDNEMTQKVVWSCPDNFYVLCTRLPERFQQNSDVQKERLLTDFKIMKHTQKESPGSITVEFIPLLRNYEVCLTSM